MKLKTLLNEMTYNFTLTHSLSIAKFPLIHEVQDKHLCMLLDTWSNINMLDTKVYNYFFINKSCLGTE